MNNGPSWFLRVTGERESMYFATSDIRGQFRIISNGGHNSPINSIIHYFADARNLANWCTKYFFAELTAISRTPVFRNTWVILLEFTMNGVLFNQCCHICVMKNFLSLRFYVKSKWVTHSWYENTQKFTIKSFFFFAALDWQHCL